MVVSDEQKKDTERKVNSMKQGKVVEKKEEGQVRKSSHIKAIQNKEPSKGINEILFKQSPKHVTLHEKKRLIKEQHRHKEGKMIESYDSESKVVLRGKQRLI